MNQPDKVIYLATKTGSCLLESGAETYRVEDTICRILASFDMVNNNCFSTPTGIMSSCVYEDKTYSQVARIKTRNTNLDRIDKLNQLSRDASTLTIREYEKRLDQIIQEKPYSDLETIIFAGFTSFGFTLVFKGIIFDALIAFVLGCLVRYFTIVFEKKLINSFFIIVWCSFVVSLITVILGYLKLVQNVDIVIIGTIMLLVPGLAITNAIRDFLAGDLVSGVARAFEATLVAIAVAVGSGIAMTLLLALGGLL